MQLAEIECRECGVLNSSQAEKCGACGKPLYTVDATLQSADDLALTTPSDPGVEPAVTGRRLPDPAADTAASDPSVDDTVDGTILGRPDHTLVGTMVGEYQVSGVIGEGGMGTVFAGVHPLIGKEVAIKVLKPSLSDDNEVMERFLAEAKAVNTIRHPNIIDIFSFGQLNDESQYFVMEYLSGRSLAAYLKQQRTVSYDAALNILNQVLGALKAAHERGIVHRDLKPDNIYLADHPSGGFIVKLLDFGIAKFTEDGVSVGHTRTGVPIGTPLYMSPEQCRGRDVGHHSDIYSLGVIMYEMFTGRPPFAAKTVYQLVNSHVHQPPVKPSSLIDFPPDLEKVILWCLAKDKMQRPQSVSELKARLNPVLERLAGESSAPTPMPSLPEGDIPDDLSGPAYVTGDPAQTTTHVPTASRTGLFVILGIVLAAAAVAIVLLLQRPDRKPKDAPGAPAPVAMAPTDATTTQRARPKTVLLQFLIYPKTVQHSITVDGKPVRGKLHEVPRSKKRPVKIRVLAEGYMPYEAEWTPVSDYTLPVQLVKRTEPMAMEPSGRRRRRRTTWRPPPMRPVSPPPGMRKTGRIMGATML